MAKTPNNSNKIIKILAEKPAVSFVELTKEDQGKSKYAIIRSIKGLEEAGLIESITSAQGSYARLTKQGKKKAMSVKLDSSDALITNWDGKWRIILLDLPENRKNERESMRYLLKKAGFVCVKNSAWVSPYPFEHMFYNIKKDLGLTTEIMIIVTDNLDPETEQEFLNLQK